MIARLVREPNLITGLAVAAIGLAVSLGVHISDGQTGAGLLFLGAVIAVIRFVTTPASEVVAQQKGDGPVKAGPKAEDYGIVQGHVVSVDPVATPLPTPPQVAPGDPLAPGA